MNITWDLCDCMYNFIQKMKFDIWFPIKTDIALRVIMQLFDEGSIPNCELNSGKNKIRKIDLSGYDKFTINRGWYDKK